EQLINAHRCPTAMAIETLAFKIITLADFIVVIAPKTSIKSKPDVGGGRNQFLETEFTIYVGRRDGESQSVVLTEEFRTVEVVIGVDALRALSFQWLIVTELE